MMYALLSDGAGDAFDGDREGFSNGEFKIRAYI